MNWISNNKPAQGFPINILIPKAKHVNQDLRRFFWKHSDHIWRVKDFFEESEIVKLQEEEKKTTIEMKQIQIEIMSWYLKGRYSSGE